MFDIVKDYVGCIFFCIGYNKELFSLRQQLEIKQNSLCHFISVSLCIEPNLKKPGLSHILAPRLIFETLAIRNHMGV